MRPAGEDQNLFGSCHFTLYLRKRFGRRATVVQAIPWHETGTLGGNGAGMRDFLRGF